MTKRKYHRPSSPAEIALKRERERLEAQGDIRLVANPAHQITACQRLDVFELLRSRRVIDDRSYEAVRRLEREMAIAEGVDRAKADVRVDCAVAGSIDRQIEYRAKVGAVLARMREPTRKLILAITRPQFDGILTRWRETVARITGQRRESIQVERVLDAAADLAAAYVSCDYMARGKRHNAA